MYSLDETSRTIIIKSATVVTSPSVLSALIISEKNETSKLMHSHLLDDHYRQNNISVEYPKGL
jgi:hypothetical protein